VVSPRDGRSSSRAAPGERIVVLTTSYPRASGDASGHFVETHARELARAGACVTVIAPGCSADRAEVGAGSLRVLRARGEALFAWPGATARLRASPHRALYLAPFAASVARALRDAGPFDRAVAHWLVPCAWPLAHATPAPLEAWAHGADVRLLCRLPRTLRAAIVEALVARGTKLTFVASALYEELACALPRWLAAALERASVVSPAPLDVPPREHLPAIAVPPGCEDGYVIWVGRLVPSKRVAEAAAAAARASVPLVVIGDGPDEPPRGTIALGRRSREETLAYIAGARALVTTSRDEGAPTAVREARALGVRVVARAAGDLEAWAAHDDGIVIVPDAHALSRALALTARRSASSAPSGVA
jgi:glycosyltransferase involved in cell wall biosynthesis